MKNNKGFTLLELLIAATIIGALAVFATISYRSSEADTRIAAAKARTEVLAAAVQRFYLEFPRAGLGDTVISNTTGSCPGGISHTQNLSATALITCGLVDNGGWTNNYVTLMACGQQTHTAGTLCANLGSNRGACMTGGTSSRVPARYASGSYSYCVTEEGVATETFGS